MVLPLVSVGAAAALVLSGVVAAQGDEPEAGEDERHVTALVESRVVRQTLTVRARLPPERWR